MVSLEHMRKGAWGLFHELGHNHQAREWTFEGTGEVTCNLWSLYLSQNLCKIPDEAAHDALKDPNKYVGPYLAMSSAPIAERFEQWKANPFSRPPDVPPVGRPRSGGKPTGRSSPNIAA